MIRHLLSISMLIVMSWASPAQGQPGLVVISGADVASQSALNIGYIRDARIAANGSVWIAANGNRGWTGRLLSDGTVLNPNLGNFNQPYSSSPNSFTLSESRRHIAYTLDGNLWRTNLDGQHTLLVTDESETPGLISSNPSIGQFSGVGYGAGIADTGDVAFSGKVQINGVDTSNRKNGIWQTRNDTAHLIALQGEPTPGILGAVFGRLGRTNSIKQYLQVLNAPIPFVSNDSGIIAFTAEIKIPGFNFVYETGVWVNRDEGLELVARTSTPVPGNENRFFSANGFSMPVINNHGQVAIMADTSRSSRYNWDGIWRETPNGLQVVAERGNRITDIDVGEDGSASFTEFYGNDFQFNNNGTVAFRAKVDINVVELEPYSSTYRQEQGIWIADSDGHIERLAMTSSTPPLGTMGSWDQYYYSLQMNEADQVAFVVRELVRTAEETTYDVLRATQRTGNVIEILREGDLIDFGDATSPDMLPISWFELLDFDNAGRALVSVHAEDGSIALVLSDAVAAPSIYGDYNGDGQINLTDYSVWQSTFGTEVRIGDGADGNLNGRIDAADYTVWRDAFEAEALAVPEPSGLILFLALFLAKSIGQRPFPGQGRA